MAGALPYWARQFSGDKLPITNITSKAVLIISFSDPKSMEGISTTLPEQWSYAFVLLHLLVMSVLHPSSGLGRKQVTGALLFIPVMVNRKSGHLE